MAFQSDLQNAFNFLESNVLADALATNLPLVGTALSDAASGFGVTDFRDAIVSAFEGAANPADPAQRAAAVAAALDAVPGVSATADSAAVSIRLTRTLEAAAQTGQGDLGLGATGAALSVEGSFAGTIAAELDIALSYDAGSDTLSYVPEDGDEVSLSAVLDVEYAAGATLGPELLSVSVTETGDDPELSVSIGVDVSGPSPASVSISAPTGGLALDPRVEIGVLVDYLPQFYAQFAVDWDLQNPTATPAIDIPDLGVDVASLIARLDFILEPVTDFLFDGIVGAIIEVATDPIPGIDDVFEALELPDPIPNGQSFLAGGIPADPFTGFLSGGDGTFNFLDALGAYFRANGRQEDYVRLSIIAEVLGYLKLVDELQGSDADISLGSVAIDAQGNLGAFTPSNEGGLSPLERAAQFIQDTEAFQQVVDAVEGLTEGGNSAFSDAALDDEEGVSFPLLENPERIVNILFQAFGLGGPEEIVRYDFPGQRLEGYVRAVIPILGPIQVELEGGVALGFDFAVGYDTLPITTLDALDGLFITTQELGPEDWSFGDRIFEFAPLAHLESFIEGGLKIDAVVASAEAGGRISGFLGAFLPGGEQGPGYVAPSGTDGTLRGAQIAAGCFFDPFFGQVLAEIFAEFKAGIGPFSVTERVVIADRILASFELGCTESLEIEGLGRLTAADTVRLNVGPDRPFRIIDGAVDPNTSEAFTVAQAVGEDGAAIPGGITISYAQWEQTFGADTPITLLTADFGEANDFFAAAADLTQRMEILGGSGDDVIRTGAADDVLEGGDGRDVLEGRDGDDELRGGADDDKLEGGAGADLIFGGSGFDEVTYEGSPVGVTFDVFVSGPVTAFVGKGGDAEGDVLNGIERITGSAFDDVLYANPLQASHLSGRDGSDALIGGGAGDFLAGGEGGDLIDGAGGDDATSYYDSEGGVSVDLLTGIGSGGAAAGDTLISIEMVQGSFFADMLKGTLGADTLTGLGGGDLIDGRGGGDAIAADRGDDTVRGHADGGTVDGGEGRDLLSYEALGSPVIASLDQNAARLIGSLVVETIAEAALRPGEDPAADRRSSFEDLDGTDAAGPAGDELEGDQGGNLIRGLGGDDLIAGLGGNDTLQGGQGADTMTGGSGRDVADYSDGFIVDIALDGSPGTGSTAQGDELSGIEDLIGTDGADVLEGDGGGNRIDPGLSRSAGPDDVTGGGGTDRLILDYSRGDTGQGLTGSLDGGAFQRLDAAGATVLDRVQFTSIEEFYLTGTQDGDSLTVGAGDDRILTGGGGDLVDAGTGSDYVVAGDDGDGVRYRRADGDGPFFLDGGRGTDRLQIDLRSLDEPVTISGPEDVQDGVNLRLIDGSAAQNFEVLSEVLTGGGADRLIQTGVADNAFRSGAGADVLTPGLGIDAVGGEEDFGDGLIRLPSTALARYDLAPGTTEADVLGMPGDTLQLDYGAAASGVRSIVNRQFASFVELDGNPRVSGRDLLIFAATAGEYGTTDMVNLLDFDTIERVVAQGSAFADLLYGTWRGAVRQFENGTRLGVDADRGDDEIAGAAGSDVLIGLTGSDALSGEAGADTLVGSDPLLSGQAYGGNPLEPLDRFQVDTLTGGAGADLFVVGVAPDGAATQGFYRGRLVTQDDLSDARAVVTDFDASEGDGIQLAGSAADYVLEVQADRTLILAAGAERDIVAELTGVTDFFLDGPGVQYADAGDPGWQPSDTLSLPIAARAAAPAARPLTTGDWITQTGNPSLLRQELFGNTGQLSDGQLRLTGDARAFGFLRPGADPLGIGGGIVLSTGRVLDLEGPNDEDGGVFGPEPVSLDFDAIGRDEANGVNFYRAAVGTLIEGLRTITLVDDDIPDTFGTVAGADIDAIIVSRQRIDALDAATDFNAIGALDVFDYSAAGTFYVAGTSSQPLNGAVNGIVDASVATLGVSDFVGGLTTGFVSMGDGGTLTFELTEAVDSLGPLYVYLAEAGAVEAVQPGVSGTGAALEPPGDVSTDFGAPGPEDDTIVFDYRFGFGVEPGTAPMLALDVAYFTEELTEFAGETQPDTFSIRLNGVELARLSDGAAATLNTLKPAALSVDHPDLILNPDLDGPQEPGPLAKDLSIDAYTVQTTVMGALQDGTNRLVIEVADHRDGFLDSGMVLSSARLLSGDGGPKPGGPEIGPPVAPVTEGEAFALPVRFPDLPRARADVTVILTPTDDLDLGSGAGVPVETTLSPRGPAPRGLELTAVAGDGIEPTEFASILIETRSDDPAFDGLVSAPVLIQIEDPATAGGGPIEGTDGDDALVGTPLDDTIDGGAGDDSIEGREGADELTGGPGDDTLAGGRGDDLYRLDGRRDRVVEAEGAGRDEVRSETTVRLRDAEIEVVRLAGGDIDVFGNGFDTRLVGGAGDNILVGGGGLDEATGHAGNDVFVLQARPGTMTITDFGPGDRLAVDDGFFGPAGGIDPRPVTAREARDLLESGAAAYGRATGELRLNGDVVAILEGGPPLGLNDVLLF